MALATTELPTVIADGETGYVSCDVSEHASPLALLGGQDAGGQNV
jgi:hypothetical protein